MKARTRIQDLPAGLLSLLAACASSPAAFDGGEPDLATDDDPGSEPDEPDEEADEPAPPEEEEDVDPVVRGPSQGTPNGSRSEDAGASSGTRDAGGPVVRAPAGSGNAGRDAGSAGQPSAPSDTGGSSGSASGEGSCTQDTECTNSCFPVGILPCCNALGFCGCSWAPGAYCL